MSEINENLENELNKQFLKGDENRGKALVLVAIAQIEIDKLQNILIDRDKKLNRILIDTRININKYKKKMNELEKEIKLLWKGIGVEKI